MAGTNSIGISCLIKQSKAADEDVHVVVVDKVVGHEGVDDDQSGPPETIHLIIMNILKA